MMLAKTPAADEDHGGKHGGSSRRSFGQLIIALMSGAMISKILGFVREIAMALIIGTAVVADAFRTSITLILLPISFFQSEAVPAILIPMQQEEIGRGRGPASLAALTIALGMVSAVLMVAVQIFGLLLVDWVVVGFTAEQKALTFSFMQIMALAMPASVMLNVLAAGEIALGRARIANARAAFQNVSVLIGIGCVALGGDVILLGWAFSAAFNGVLLWACFCLLREGELRFEGLTVGRIVGAGTEFFRRLRPFVPLPIAEQANIWVERLCASRLQTGAIASLDYARTLTESFQLVISQPVGLAVLAHSEEEKQEAQAKAIARIVLAFALPACAFLHVFAVDIVTLVFKRGAFGDTGLLLTSQALKGISLGLWASTLGWILLRMLTSRRRNLRAAFILIAAYLANMGFNALGSAWAGPGGGDTMLIGIGETVRAFVLLAGVILSVPGGLKLLPIIGLAAIPALAMAGLGTAVQHMLDGTLARLVCGGATLVVCVIAAAVLLMPSLVDTAIGKLKSVLDRPK